MASSHQSFEAWLKKEHHDIFTKDFNSKNLLEPQQGNFDAVTPGMKDGIMFNMIGAHFNPILIEIQKRISTPASTDREQVKVQIRDLLLANALLIVHRQQQKLVNTLNTEGASTQQQDEMFKKFEQETRKPWDAARKEVCDQIHKLSSTLKSMKKGKPQHKDKEDEEKTKAHTTHSSSGNVPSFWKKIFGGKGSTKKEHAPLLDPSSKDTTHSSSSSSLPHRGSGNKK